MSNETNSKKLLLGSALAGLMVAAPGLSVTTGKFFQTASLKVGYALAQAAEATTSGSQTDDTTMEGDPATKGKKVNVTEAAPPVPESQPTTPPSTEKKGDKSCSADKSCGSGSCGSGH